jgi:hypothetical protein
LYPFSLPDLGAPRWGSFAHESPFPVCTVKMACCVYPTPTLIDYAGALRLIFHGFVVVAEGSVAPFH